MEFDNSGPDANQIEQLIPNLFDLYSNTEVHLWRSNMVTTINGAISYEGKSAPLSNSIDRLAFKVQRSLASAVVAGAKNVVAEGYFSPLQRPIPIDNFGHPIERNPNLVVITNGKTSLLDSALVKESKAPFTIITSTGGIGAVTTEMESAQVEVEIISCGDDRVDFNRARSIIDERFSGTKLVEGGPSIVTGMQRSGVLDQFAVTITPKMSAATPPFVGDTETTLSNLTLYRYLVAFETLLLLYKLN